MIRQEPVRRQKSCFSCSNDKCKLTTPHINTSFSGLEDNGTTFPMKIVLKIWGRSINFWASCTEGSRVTAEFISVGFLHRLWGAVCLSPSRALFHLFHTFFSTFSLSHSLYFSSARCLSLHLCISPSLFPLICSHFPLSSLSSFSCSLFLFLALVFSLIASMFLFSCFFLWFFFLDYSFILSFVLYLYLFFLPPLLSLSLSLPLKEKMQRDF